MLLCNGLIDTPGIFKSLKSVVFHVVDQFDEENTDKAIAKLKQDTSWSKHNIDCH